MSNLNKIQDDDKEINTKIVAGLEKISQAFKVILWNENKKYGLSPIQLQIIVFLLSHNEEFRTISNLANEFNTTKASISDSVKLLEKKGFVYKEKNKNDSRVSTITLTEKSINIAKEISKFSEVIANTVDKISPEKKVILLESLLEIIHELFNQNIISIQRMCFTCCYYNKSEDNNYFCSIMSKEIKSLNLEVDCNEYK